MFSFDIIGRDTQQSERFVGADGRGDAAARQKRNACVLNVHLRFTVYGVVGGSSHRRQGNAAGARSDNDAFKGTAAGLTGGRDFQVRNDGIGAGFLADLHFNLAAQPQTKTGIGNQSGIGMTADVGLGSLAGHPQIAIGFYREPQIGQIGAHSANRGSDRAARNTEHIPGNYVQSSLALPINGELIVTTKDGKSLCNTETHVAPHRSQHDGFTI